MGALGVLLAAASTAPANPPRRYATPNLDQVADSAHFEIHYSIAPTDPDAIEPDRARQALANAEKAYAAEIGTLGFPAPISDGDGRTDVYVTEAARSGAGDVAAITPGDRRSPTSAYIVIKPEYVTSAQVVAHEFFHVLQWSIRIGEDNWLTEASANWGAYAGLGVAGSLGIYSHPEVSLDCASKTFLAGCAGDGYGYGRWPFWQSLSERYGPAVMLDVFRHAASLAEADRGPHTIQAIQAALADLGTDLSTAFLDFTQRAVSGAFALPNLKDATPAASAALFTGSAGGAVAPASLTVDHLAARYVLVRSGDASGAGAPCHGATLQLTVSWGGGAVSRPVLAEYGGAATPLTISGSQASVAVPWTTCPGKRAKLSLPNGALGAAGDGSPFTVASSLSITPARAPAPPTQAPPATEVSSVPTSDPTDAPAPAPTLIELRYPHTVRLRRGRPTLVHFHIVSSGAGSILISAGTHRDEDPAYERSVHRNLKPGANDIVLRLPRGYKHRRDFVSFTEFSQAFDSPQAIVGAISNAISESAQGRITYVGARGRRH